MKAPRSYLVNGALASAVLYFVFDLSRSGRTAVEWIVLGIVASAVLYNLVQLGRRLLRVGGGGAVGHLVRTLLFWIGGLFNTVLARPRDVGSWKYVLGWALVVTAAVDSVAVYRKEQAAARPPAGRAG
jgi:hypothetical protein